MSKTIKTTVPAPKGSQCYWFNSVEKRWIEEPLVALIVMDSGEDRSSVNYARFAPVPAGDLTTYVYQINGLWGVYWSVDDWDWFDNAREAFEHALYYHRKEEERIKKLAEKMRNQ